MPKIAICWLRRDLRLEDNAALYHALKSGLPVLPLFIFDRHILDALQDPADARVSFIHQRLSDLRAQLAGYGSSLAAYYGHPEALWPQILAEHEVAAVFANRDYEPYALQRDAAVRAYLEGRGVAWQDFKDHVVFEKDEVLKDDGGPYVVFTPYSRRWMAKLESRLVDTPEGPSSFYLQSYPTLDYAGQFWRCGPQAFPSLADMGFRPSAIAIPSTEVRQGLIRAYADKRDFPAEAGTSRLGIHFRFGSISIREKARKAKPLSQIFLNELIWRDFYSQIMAHFPKVVGQPFSDKYAAIPWRNDEAEFAAWCAGRTGYPLVDAGMRELNATGFMHNRVRMVVASFLSKHLLIDWRWGEAYFAEKLLDFDLASNNGGWQWAAGCGTDAAPYFRVFNPEAQQKKFDPDGRYVRRWVPEYGTARYPKPIVEHKMARERCLNTYKTALEKAS